jgi:hypothetical protein
LLLEPGQSLRFRGLDLVLWGTIVGPRDRWRPTHLPFDTVVVENDRGFASWLGLYQDEPALGPEVIRLPDLERPAFKGGGGQRLCLNPSQ